MFIYVFLVDKWIVTGKTSRPEVLGIFCRQAGSMGLLGGCCPWEMDLGTLTIKSLSGKPSEFGGHLHLWEGRHSPEEVTGGYKISQKNHKEIF